MTRCFWTLPLACVLITPVAAQEAFVTNPDNGHHYFRCNPGGHLIELLQFSALVDG